MSDRILRIDITSSNPLFGKTTLAAVIAKAVKEQFPDQRVEVLAQENDFLIRAQDLMTGHPLKLNADLVQIVDMNSNPQPFREGAIYNTIPVSFEELPTGSDPINYPERPLALETIVTRALEAASKGLNIDPMKMLDLHAKLLGDGVFQQAAEEFECDRGDQYEKMEPAR